MYMPGIFGEDLFDNWMEDAMNSRSSNDRRGYARNDSGLMRTDIREAGGNYMLEIELPGFKKEEVSIKLENGTMTVTATKKAEDSPRTGYVRKERWTGSCTRSFYVGDALRGEDVKARMENGILLIIIPKEVKKVPENHTVIIEG